MDQKYSKLLDELSDSELQRLQVAAERDAARAELAECRAERALYGDMMAERLGACENERDGARAEAAKLRETIKRGLLDYEANDLLNDLEEARTEADALREEVSLLHASMDK